MADSPMMLSPTPRGKGVRRLNKLPLFAAGGVLVLAMGAIGYTYHEKSLNQIAEAKKAETTEVQGAGSHANDFFANQQPPTPTAPMSTTAPLPTQPTVANDDARKKAWDAYYAQVAAVAQARSDAEGKALSAGLEQATSGPSLTSPTGVAAAGGPAGATPASPPAAGVDAGAQAEKRAFLNQGGDTSGANENLIALTHGPKLDTIMQGTAIPGTMVGGLTSDMPGMVIGSVSENVCDTATGNDLLIPQGTRVIGAYDNSVSNGQSRIGVIWNRLIFPDTSSLQIGGMEGADQGGYAGFKDQVDTHFWEKFGAATMISLAGAGAQLAQPQTSAFATPSGVSAATGQLTQGYSQLGQEYARNGLSIPNTLEIRPGYVFRIMTNKDMHLPRRGSCQDPGDASLQNVRQPVRYQ